MKDLYDQQPNECPFDWINRVIKTIAMRALWFALAMMLIGYFVGSVK